MKKAEVSRKAGSKAVKSARGSEQQTEDERYEALLSRIRASLAMCQMMTDELSAAYKELKELQEQQMKV